MAGVAAIRTRNMLGDAVAASLAAGQTDATAPGSDNRAEAASTCDLPSRSAVSQPAMSRAGYVTAGNVAAGYGATTAGGFTDSDYAAGQVDPGAGMFGGGMGIADPGSAVPPGAFAGTAGFPFVGPAAVSLDDGGAAATRDEAATLGEPGDIALFAPAGSSAIALTPDVAALIGLASSAPLASSAALASAAALAPPSGTAAWAQAGDQAISAANIPALPPPSAVALPLFPAAPGCAVPPRHPASAPAASAGLAAGTGGIAEPDNAQTVPVAANVAASGATSASVGAALLTDVLYLQEPGDTSAISINDIHQGQIGDCFLLSSIGELALWHPAAITSMIYANADGTETVALHLAASGALPTFGTTSFELDQVTVNNTFLSDGVNNGATQDVVGNQKEIWVQVLEKAVATMEGGYSAIANGGNPMIAMEELTGDPATSDIACLADRDSSCRPTWLPAT